jgi:hypothetical protein
MMHHKDYRRINAWLSDLREKGYIGRIYSTDFTEKTKPAICYLALNGIRELGKQTTKRDDGQEHHAYPVLELRKRYRESSRSAGFVARSVLIAECCMVLEAKTNQETRYVYMVPVDYASDDHNFHFLAESETANPHLCFIKEQGAKGSGTIANYLLEVLDETLPRYRLKFRIKQYIAFLSDDEWESGDNDPPPIILLVCANKTDLIYAKRRAKALLDNDWDTDDEDRPHIRFATTAQVKQEGVTARIWEQA